MTQKTNDYLDAIDELANAVKQICRNKNMWANDEIVLKVLTSYYQCLYNQIHNVLAIDKNDYHNELKIRELIARHVIGCKDKETGKVYIGALTVIENKISQVNKAKNVDNELLIKYNQVYSDFFALAAFRSMKHFALYMEWDLPPDKRIFNMTLNCFGGYWFYATQAVLDNTWNKLFSQAPTGYGKSYKDTVTMAFIFGYEIDADILKVCGNPSNITPNSNRLVKYMLKPAYAKVFPYYAQFNGERDKMFDVCQIGGSDKPTRLLIHGSDKGESLLFCNKQTPIDGNRYKYKFYDDITRSIDKNNVAQHERDVEYYSSEWERRKYDDFHNVEFFSGTAYHNEDFLCTIKRQNGADFANQSIVNKYTWYNDRFKSIFVKVPKLDYETDKITFPQMYSEEAAKRKRDTDPQEFYAMDQQEPMPIKGCPFDYKNLMTYAVIPYKENEQYDYYAVLDPARTGANFVAMPIFVKIDNLFYFVDCVFEMRAIEDLHNEIAQKINRYKICQFHIERNTDTSLKTLIQKLVNEMGYYNCNFSEVYSVKNKAEKIQNAEAAIRNNLVFPEFNLFGMSRAMRNFMKYFTSYSYLAKNKYDDAPDSLAMFANKFVRGNNRNRKATTIQL